MQYPILLQCCGFQALSTVSATVVKVIDGLIQIFFQRRESGQNQMYLQWVCLHAHPKVLYRGHKYIYKHE